MLVYYTYKIVIKTKGRKMKILQWLLAGFMLVVLTACGGGTQDKPTKTNISSSHQHMKLVIPNGSMQEIPFDIQPKIEKLPQAMQVRYTLDDQKFSATDKITIDKPGVYHLTAQIENNNSDIIETLDHEIVAYQIKTVKTLAAKKDKGTEEYIYSDSNSSLSGVKIEVPKNALIEDTKITINESTAVHIPNVEGMGAISKVLTMEPSGLKFKKPVLITMPYDENVSKDELYIARYSKGGEIDFIKPYLVDEKKHIASFYTDHFTNFQLERKYKIFAIKDIKDQSVITDISNLTGIGLSQYTNAQWKDILNYELVKGKGYTVYDLYLDFKKLDTIRKKFDQGKYKEAIKVYYPGTKSGLDKRIETMKAASKAIDIVNTVTSFDPKSILKSSDLARELTLVAVSAVGLPTSVSDITDINTYIPDPLDTVALHFGKIDDLFYTTLMDDLQNAYTYGYDNGTYNLTKESAVYHYDVCQDDIMLAFASNDLCKKSHSSKQILKDDGIVTPSMVKNLKLTYLHYLHFKDHKNALLSNLKKTIQVIAKNDNKYVTITMVNHERYPVKPIEPYFYPDFKICPKGYRIATYIDEKNPEISFYYQGKELKKIRLDEDYDENYCFSLSEGLDAFDEPGNYILDWKYKDKTGYEDGGKYYFKQITATKVKPTGYKINKLDLEQGLLRAEPLFGSEKNVDYSVGYTFSLKIGNTVYQKHNYNYDLKITDLDQIISHQSGDKKYKALAEATLQFSSLKSSQRTVEPISFKINLLNIAKESNLFNMTDIWIAKDKQENYYINGEMDPYVTPVRVDFEGDGKWDRELRQNEWKTGNVAYPNSLEKGRLSVKIPKQAGIYYPCITFKHTRYDISKVVCLEYPLNIKASDDETTEEEKEQVNLPPIISLNGSNPVTLYTNEAYSEPGATAKDTYGNNIKVTIDSSVDSTQSGVYHVTYRAVDKVGNKTTKRRTVIVKGTKEEIPESHIIPISKLLSIPRSTGPADSCYSFFQTGCEALVDEGKTYSKSWTFTNTGNVELTHLKIVSLQQSKGISVKVSKPIDSTIEVGKTGTVKMNITVPDNIEPGIYKGRFKIVDDKGDILYTSGNSTYFWYMFNIPEKLPSTLQIAPVKAAKVNDPLSFKVTVNPALNSHYSVKISLGDGGGGWLLPQVMTANSNRTLFSKVNRISKAGKRKYRVAIFRGNTQISAWYKRSYSVYNNNKIPQNLKATQTDTGMLLSWDPVKGASYYVPMYSLDFTKNGTYADMRGGCDFKTATSCLVDTHRFKTQKTWYFAVNADNGMMSDPVSFIWKETPTEKPHTDSKYKTYLAGKTFYVPDSKMKNLIYKYAFNKALTTVNIRGIYKDGSPGSLTVQQLKLGTNGLKITSEKDKTSYWILKSITDNYLILENADLTDSGVYLSHNYKIKLYFTNPSDNDIDAEDVLVGNTFYQYCQDNKELFSLAFGSDNILTMQGDKDKEQVTYTIQNNSLSFIIDGEEEHHTLEEVTENSIAFGKDSDDIFYMSQSDAKAHPATNCNGDDDKDHFIVINSLISGHVDFKDRTSIPSDAFVGIVPSRYQNDASGWNRLICKINSDGDFGNECYIDHNEKGMREALTDTSETFQVVVFQNHIEAKKYHWNCGENLYAYIGSNETYNSWSYITVKNEDYQDRSDEKCHEDNDAFDPEGSITYRGHTYDIKRASSYMSNQEDNNVQIFLKTSNINSNEEGGLQFTLSKHLFSDNHDFKTALRNGPLYLKKSDLAASGLQFWTSHNHPTGVTWRSGSIKLTWLNHQDQFFIEQNGAGFVIPSDNPNDNIAYPVYFTKTIGQWTDENHKNNSRDYQLISDLVSGHFSFEDENGTAQPVPSNTWVRITPEENQIEGYWNGINCKIDSHGNFGKACYIHSDESKMRSYFQSSYTKTYQVIIYTEVNGDTHWGKGEPSNGHLKVSDGKDPFNVKYGVWNNSVVILYTNSTDDKNTTTPTNKCADNETCEYYDNGVLKIKSLKSYHNDGTLWYEYIQKYDENATLRVRIRKNYEDDLWCCTETESFDTNATLIQKQLEQSDGKKEKTLYRYYSNKVMSSYETTTTDGDGEILEIRKHLFDKKGNFISETRLSYPNGNWDKTVKTYLNGKLIKSEFEKYDGSKAVKERKYDTNGILNTVTNIMYDADGRWTNVISSYNKNGRIFYTKTENSDGTYIISTYKFNKDQPQYYSQCTRNDYDSSGNKTAYILTKYDNDTHKLIYELYKSYYSNGSWYRQTTTYKQNTVTVVTEKSNGLKTITVRFYKNNKLVREEEKSYNEEVFYRWENKTFYDSGYIKHYEYKTYDDDGNITESKTIEYDEDGNEI